MEISEHLSVVDGFLPDVVLVCLVCTRRLDGEIFDLKAESFERLDVLVGELLVDDRDAALALDRVARMLKDAPLPLLVSKTRRLKLATEYA